MNKALNEQPRASTSADLADENFQFSDDVEDNIIEEEFLDTEDTGYPNSETQESEGMHKNNKFYNFLDYYVYYVTMSINLVITCVCTFQFLYTGGVHLVCCYY